jgi:chromosome partitioning protein
VLSVRTLDQLTEFVAGFNGHRPEVRAFFSMVDRRKELHQEIIQDLSAERVGVAATSIPSLSLIERMEVERAPVTALAPAARPPAPIAPCGSSSAPSRPASGAAGRPASAR